MATVLLSKSTNAFSGFHEGSLGHFNHSFASSRIASSAYQKRPTREVCIQTGQGAFTPPTRNNPI